MKRSSWSDYQKEIADDKYYYVRSCIRQNFFPGSEKAFLNMLQRIWDAMSSTIRCTPRVRASATIRTSCRWIRS